MAICAARGARYGDEASSLGASGPGDRRTNPFLVATVLPRYDRLDECDFHDHGGADFFFFPFFFCLETTEGAMGWEGT